MISIQRMVMAFVVVSAIVPPALGQEPAVRPAVKIQYFWGESQPIAGVTEDKGVVWTESGDLLYLHKQPVLTNKDIVKVEVNKMVLGSDGMDLFTVKFHLTKEARKRLAETCGPSGNKMLAAKINGFPLGNPNYAKSRDESQFTPFAGLIPSKDLADRIVATFAPPAQDSRESTSQSQATPAKPGIKVELRWAEFKVVPDLTLDKGVPFGEGDAPPIYLHKKAVLTNEDILEARIEGELTLGSALKGPVYGVNLYLTEDGKKKLARAGEPGKKKLLVTVMDGRDGSAFYVDVADLSKFVQPVGYYYKDQAERLVAGINRPVEPAPKGADPAPQPQTPQPAEKEIKLPDGWSLTPAGLHVPLAAVPLNLIPSTKSKSVHVGTSSLAAHQLSIIELETGKTLAKADVGESWYGLTALTFVRDEVLIWSGGASGKTHFFTCTGTSLAQHPPSRPEDSEAAEYPGKFRSGIAARGQTHLYAWLDMDMGKLCVSSHGMGIENFAMHYVGGKQPLDVAWSRDQHWIYVSDWADKKIIVGHLPGGGPGPQPPSAIIEVGERPNQIAVHPTDWRVFVACAGSNTVTVIDGKTNTMIETISTRLDPTVPQRSNPDALALAPDGKTLYVANADNHNVAVIDVTEPKMSVVKGFIPTGWNPTAVSVTPDGKTLLIGTIKATDPLPTIPEDAKDRPFPHTATKAAGELWIVPIPDEKTLVEYTAQVHKNCPNPVGKSR